MRIPGEWFEWVFNVNNSEMGGGGRYMSGWGVVTNYFSFRNLKCLSVCGQVSVSVVVIRY